MDAITILNQGGIICDNPKCDFKDSTVTDFPSYINKPCPKCGENLLTQEDFEAHEKMIAMVTLLNEVLPPVTPEDEKDMSHMSVHYHAGKLTIETKAD